MRRSRGPSTKLRTGFTLIEIIVALAVLAVALGALITGMARYADTAAILRERTLGVWVAHNRLAELQLQPGLPTIGGSDGDVTLAGIEWRWRVEVSEGADPNLRRVDITVRAQGRESDAAQFTTFFSQFH